MLQALLRMAADPRLAEDALVDDLMDVLADETPCPLSEKESCELVATYRVFLPGGLFHASTRQESRHLRVDLPVYSRKWSTHTVRGA